MASRCGDAPMTAAAHDNLDYFLHGLAQGLGVVCGRVVSALSAPELREHGSCWKLERVATAFASSSVELTREILADHIRIGDDDPGALTHSCGYKLAVDYALRFIDRPALLLTSVEVEAIHQAVTDLWGAVDRDRPNDGRGRDRVLP